jgi:Flp pilus assembly protein TadG
MGRLRLFFSRLGKKSDGVAALEMAIVFNLLLLLVVGLTDIGHAFFMRQIIINASREGGRYAVVYRGNLSGGSRIGPSPSVSTWVLQDSGGGGSYGLASLLPADASPTVTVSPDPASVNVGDSITVTVNCTKTWWFLGNFVPGLGQTIQMTAQTVMRAE